MIKFKSSCMVNELNFSYCAHRTRRPKKDTNEFSKCKTVWLFWRLWEISWGCETSPLGFDCKLGLVGSFSHLSYGIESVQAIAWINISFHWHLSNKFLTHITHDPPPHLCNSTSNPPRKWKIDFDSETRVSHKSRNWATFQSEFISMSWRSMMSSYEEGEATAVDWVMLAIRILSTTLKRNMFFNTPVDITLRCSFHLDYITKHV